VFPPDEGINEIGNEIIIKKAPYGGIKRLLHAVSTISGNEHIIVKS